MINQDVFGVIKTVFHSLIKLMNQVNLTVLLFSSQFVHKSANIPCKIVVDARVGLAAGAWCQPAVPYVVANLQSMGGGG